MAGTFRGQERTVYRDPDQLRSDFGDTDEAAQGLAEVEEADIIPEHKRRKPRKKRDESLPAHLPRQEIIVNADDADTQREEHGPKTQLPESMWDVQEKMICVPPSLYVEVRKYPKYACRDQPQCGITSAERPTGIVEGDKYDTSIATEILVNKFAYHLPIYRQQDMFAGTGWTPARSTMLNILTQCHFILQPLLGYFKQIVLDDSIVACDDTGVTLLYPKVPPVFDLSDPKQKRIALLRKLPGEFIRPGSPPRLVAINEPRQHPRRSQSTLIQHTVLLGAYSAVKQSVRVVIEFAPNRM